MISQDIFNMTETLLKRNDVKMKGLAIIYKVFYSALE